MTVTTLLWALVLCDPVVLFGECDKGCHGTYALALVGSYSGAIVMASPTIKEELR